MTIKIHGIAYSVCTERVLFTIFEKGVTDFEIVPVILNSSEQKKPEYMLMQPFGQIPVMQEGPLTMFESRAIARTIAHKYESQGTKLYGFTPMDRALVENWLEVEGQSFNPPVEKLVNELVCKVWHGDKSNQAIVDANMEKLGKVLDVYEERLSKSKYLAGDFFSLADLSHMPFTDYLVTEAKRVEIFENRPHVKAWWDDITSRPSWKKTCEFAAAALK